MIKNQNNILVIGTGVGAVLIVLLLALFFLIPGPTKLEPETMTTAETQNAQGIVIEMNQDGFSQTEIIIQKGQAITWVNQDEDFRWPASNVHPSHEIYPEFDPQEPLAPGDSWSFTFEQTGDWQFHDHLKPYFTGTITVTE